MHAAVLGSEAVPGLGPGTAGYFVHELGLSVQLARLYGI